MQIPYKSILVLERGSSVPLYVQLSNAFIQHIQSGIIPKGSKLLGSRPLAELLEINRQTVIQAFDEMQSQGWIEVLPKKGVFVSNQLPIIQAKEFTSTQIKETSEKDSILIKRASGLFLPKLIHHRLAFNDGLPDPRLAPREALAKRYAHYINYAEPALLNYTEVYGLRRFRENLATLLNQTRGLSITAHHILSTRGSQMGIYLLAHAFICSGDLVVVGELSYQASNQTFEHFGATMIT
ncbi:MAG: aminotransferase class I/II-fold pyridoxal phosphate-dependent enzyme, partial [Flectobacillus sp.]|uniref:aminotransferase class I/II-fold pyridoxal phosphate-dependent enzyme n=1 Tax=Flectobacillus sp. TaxID=50419 RepID=UPI003B9AC5F2